MFLLKKKIFTDEALHQKFKKKTSTAGLLMGGHLDCKVQQMNILAWNFFFKIQNFKTNKVRNITM